MHYHTSDQDSDDPIRFLWSEVYKDDHAWLAHLANTAVGFYLEADVALGTDFSFEFSELWEIKWLQLWKEKVFPLGSFKKIKVYQSLKLEYYLICLTKLSIRIWELEVTKDI